MKTPLRLLVAVTTLALFSCQPPERQQVPVGHSLAPLFTNGGFETGAFAPDWTVSTFLNSTGLQNPPWPPATVANLRLSAGGNNLSNVVGNPVPESQPFAGLSGAAGQPRWPKFGINSAVVNKTGLNRNVNSIKQSYTTTSADVDPLDDQLHVRFVLAPALQSAGHVQEQQPYFFVILRNLTAPRAGDLYSNFNFSNSPGTPWQQEGTGANAVLFTDWTVFDIAPGNTALQVGDTVQVEVFASGCQPSGHWGEVYVDGFGAKFPGLSVHKTAPTQVNVDSDLTYVFTVENNTSGAAPDVVADEVLPPNTTFVSLSAPAGVTCSTPPVGGTGTVTCNFGWMNPSASQTFSVTVHAWAPAANAKGMATAGTATTLSDTTQAWAVNGFRGYTVFITGGTGVGQQREIGSNTATQLTVSSAWATTPDATSTYAIVNPPRTSGTATAGAGGSITDGTKAWTGNQWSGYTVSIVAGTGAGQSRRITGNNATRLNVTPNWTTTPNTTSVYEVKLPPTVNNGNYGVKSSTAARLLGQGVITTITAGVGYADLGLTKTDGVAALTWGSPVTYTLTVTNDGPSAVTNAQVVDTFQAPLAANPTWTCSATAGSSCVTASGTGTISNGVNLDVGGVATFTVTGAVVSGSGTSTLTNTATVTAPAGLTDNVPTNNSDTDVDAVGTVVTLTLNKVAGTGEGTVTSSPLAISCGPGCTTQNASYITGQSVTLTSVARSGDTFLGWGGACAAAGTASTCTLTIAGATTVTVNYTGPTITGTVSGGNGSVVCSPANLAQGGTSTCSFAPNAGFAIGAVTDNGIDVTASVVNGAYAIANVDQDHAVVVTYAALPQVPVLTAPVDGSTLASSSTTFSGTTSAVAGLTVTVRVDGSTICTATTVASGAFSCVGSGLADGAHVATAAATNANGTSADSTPVSFTVDTKAPVTPVVIGPANGSVVSTATPTVTGTGEPGSIITVRIDGLAVAGAPVVAGNGTWSLVVPAALTNGSHTVSAIAKDAVGNTSLASNVNTFTVNTAAGAPVLTSPVDNSTVATTTPVLSGTAPAGVTVTVLVDGVVACSAVASGGGAFACLSPALANGAHQAVASIPAGGGAVRLSNTSTFTIDTTTPAAPVVLAPANGSSTTSTSPTISGTAEPLATVTILLEGSSVGTTSADLSGRFSFAVAGPLALGAHTAAATATDSAGHVSPSSAVNTFTVVATTGAVVFLSPPNGSTVSSATPLLFGTSAAFASIQARVDGVVVCSTFATVGGNWSCTPSSALAQGAHLGNANVTGSATLSNSNAFNVDSQVPAAPVVVSPANGSTSGPRPTLTGTAEAGTTVTVKLDGVATCVTVTSAAGAWSCVSATTLLAGVHTVNATAADAAGNVSPSSTTNTFTVDALAPLAPVVTAPANGSLTSNTKPTVSGTAEANATVTVYVDGLPVGTAVANGLGAWTFTLVTALADGTHFVRATAADAAGNVSPSSATSSFTVDSTPPAVPVVTAPANGSVTGNNKPAVSGTAEANSTVSVYLDGVLAGTTTASGAGAWSFTPASALADGSHSARATATDAAGNTSANSNTVTFTVDTTPPAAPVVSAPANGSSTNNTKPLVSGTAEANATVSVYFDGVLAGTATANGSGAWTFTPSVALSAASHTVRATATDAAGNVSVNSNTNTFTIDTTPPAAPVVSAPANGSFTSNTTPLVSGTAEASSTVSVYLDGVLAGTTTASGAGAWSFTPASALADGSHTARATATDAAGNVSGNSNTNTFTVDTTAPSAPVVSAPANGSVTGNNKPAVSGTAEANSTVSVYLDGVLAGTTTASGAGAWSFTPASALADGSHSARATATDAAGNVSANSNTVTFTVDTTAPGAPVVSAPANGSSTNATKPPVSGTAEANATVSVYFDGVLAGTTSANGSGAWTFTPSTALSAASHTVRATATDAAGNVSGNSNTNTFTIDTTPPAAPVVSAPANGSFTSNTTPAVSGTAEANATVSVYLDGVLAGTTTASGAGAWTFTPSSALGQGSHTARATATDAAGNVSGTSNTNSFTVDTTAPSAPVVSAPANGSATSSATPVVSGTAEAGATVSVYLDGVLAGTATADGSGAWTFTPVSTLGEGTHTVRATATDAAGNVSGTSPTNSFTVDLTPPVAPVLTAPAQGAFTSVTPAFSGTAEASSTVTVLVDGASIGTAAADTSGNWTFTPTTALSAGAHTASAKATDAAGNVSPVSNVNDFTVRSAVPAAPALTAPANNSTSNVTTTAFTGTAEAGSTVSVRVDGLVVCTALATSAGAFSCTVSSALAAGPHVATASAVNVVGSSLESAPVQFSIDTTPPLTPVVLSPPDGSQINTATPTILGTVEPGLSPPSVQVRIDGASVGLATVAVSGRWSLALSTPLADGSHTVDAVASDAAGNQSLGSNVNHFVVDTSVTGAPALTKPADGSAVYSSTPAFSGTAAAGAVVTVRVDGAAVCSATASSAGDFTCTAGSALTVGSHVAVATTPDGAGGLKQSNPNVFFVVTSLAAPLLLSPADGSTTTSSQPLIVVVTEPLALVDVEFTGPTGSTTVFTADANGVMTIPSSVVLSPGAYTVRATATRGGLTTPWSNVNSFTIVVPSSSAVKLSTPVDGSSTANATPSLSGTASAGASVEARVDGAVVCTASATASGAWICTPSAALADGAHVASANIAGDTALSNTNAFIVDTSSPVAPVVLKPADGSTAGPTPLLSGTAEAGARVTVSLDGAAACVIAADATGAWSCVSGTSLTAGSHTVSATSTDRAGNASPPSATNTFTVVIGTPSVPTLTSPANGSSTNDTTPDFSGTASAGSTVTVTVDGATVCTTIATAGGTFTCTTTTVLGVGAHVALASASNVNGSSLSSAPVTFSIDLTAPATPVVVGPANGSRTTSTTPAVTGTGEPLATITVRFDGASAGTTTVLANGTWTFTPTTALALGSHTVSALATDAAGNASQPSNTNTFTIDTLTNAPVVTTPADNSFTSTATPALSGTAPATASVSVRIDGSIVCTATAANSGAFTCTPSAALSQGAHALTATIPDGNGGTLVSNTNTFTVDTSTPPAPVITSPPDGSTIANVLPVIRGTALPFASVAVWIDSVQAGTATADASGVFTLPTTSPLAVATHQVNATQTTLAGRTSAFSATNTFTITASSSSITLLTPVDGSVTTATKPVLSGTATPGLDVQARVDAVVVCTATVDASGAWSCTPTTAVADGVHIADARPVGAPFTSNSTSFTVDTAAPVAPTVTAPADGSTTGPTPTLAGTAEAGARVTAFIDGTAACVAVANAAGDWTCLTPSPLAAGPHSVSAVAVDAAGNSSPASASNAFTVLTTVPGVPVLNVPAQSSLTSDSTPAYSGTADAGSTVTVRVDGQVVCTTTATTAGTFSCTPTTTLPDGPHVVTVSASNVQGTSLESPPTTFTVDTQPPTSPVIVGPSNGSQTTDPTPTVTGTGEPGSTVTILIDGTPAGTATVGPDGTFTFTVPSDLPPGTHTITATATDPAGNTSPPSNTSTFTVDPAGTSNPVLLAPADNTVISAASPTLSGTAPAGSSVTVLVDGSISCVTTATSSGTFSCAPGAPLSAGQHRAVATTGGADAGTLVSNTNTFDVDLGAPAAPVVTSPKDGATTDTRPLILGTAEPLATVSISIDGAVVGTATADASGRFTFTLPTALADGAHTVDAKATDRAGNVSPASATNTFTVMTSADAGVVLLTPPNGALVALPTPSLSGTTTPGAQVEARVDGSVVCTATATASGAWSCTPATPLSEGAHLATANLLGSTTASNTNAFTIDTQAPAAPVITSPNANGSAGATPVLAGTAEPGTRVTVSIDGNAVCVAETDAQGKWTCTPGQALTPGTHTVSAVATDSAGNASPPSTAVTFTVDTTPPTAPVLTAPADGSNTQETKPAFTGTAEASAQVTVFVDGKPVCTATASATGAFTCTPAAPLVVGAHSTNAVATDAAGNASPTSNTNAFTVTPGPATISEPANGALLNTATPTFTGTAPPNSTVTVSDGSNTVCTATADAMGTWSCTPSAALAQGAHSVIATASVNGQAGPSSAAVAFTVDTVAPVVTISGGPGSETESTDAHFTASANEPNVTFECSVDGAAFTACTSAIDLTNLSVGAHTLVVRGTDAAGNSGTAEVNWTVKEPATPGLIGTFTGGGCGCTSVDGSALAVFGALALALRTRRRPRA